MTRPLLRAVDCVVYPVPDGELPAAKRRFADDFGLEPDWERDAEVGFRLPAHRDSVGEVVLLEGADVPPGQVHYLVEDVSAAVDRLRDRGYEVVLGPADVGAARVATVRNERGHEFDLLDLNDGDD